MIAPRRIPADRRGPRLSTSAMAAAAILLGLLVALRFVAATVRGAGRLALRHLHWFCGLPTITGKVAVVAGDGIFTVCAVDLVGLPDLLRTTILTVVGLTLGFALLAGILFHSGPRRTP